LNKNLNLLIDALRNEGMRYTKQRKIVWDEICRSSEHRDAEEIF
jgi:Fe2+/Zn2+ uptake regulation proteins